MRRAAGIGAIALLLAAGFGLGLGLTLARGEGQPSVAPEPRTPPPRLVDEVRQELATGYYRTIPAKTLARPTVDGILEALGDPYTAYLTEEEYDALVTRTARSYLGVGLTVEPARRGLIVKAALEGPARKAGIRPGDLIVSIDGRPLIRLPFDRSVELIKGKEGTSVRLMIKRPREGTLKFDVKRTEIQVPAVRANLVTASGAEIAHIRLLSFRAGAAERVEQVTASLVKNGADGVVLDLRGNPGGLLTQAVGAASVYVDKGIVCVAEGRHYPHKAYQVDGDAPYPRLPLVVLVDRASASAAEIVAAALRDHRRAIVVGQRTYGKAAVQSVRELSSGALMMTTAVFRTPSGRNLAKRGLTPSVRALDDPRTRRDEALAAAKRTLIAEIRK